MAEPPRRQPEPIEPDELQKRLSRPGSTADQDADADAAAPSDDDHHRPVGSAGGGEYGAEPEE